jgi:F0F1-type ATP synthase assembly protein I
MKWYHIAFIVACIAVGAVVGVIVSHMFHVTIWIAPVLALANGVSVYLALKRRIDAQGS